MLTVNGGIGPESADASAFGRNGEVSEGPLRLHVATEKTHAREPVKRTRLNDSEEKSEHLIVNNVADL